MCKLEVGAANDDVDVTKQILCFGWCDISGRINMKLTASQQRRIT